MSTFIIGDVQGCYEALQRLLAVIDFNPDRDQLGFVGDLVNRGPDSLAVLRFVKQLKDPLVVLGNHDCYLIGLHYITDFKPGYSHTLQAVLDAPDKDELVDWLRYQPLMRVDWERRMALVHAGIPPQWTVEEALLLANEVEFQLQSKDPTAFFRQLFGNEPAAWSRSLTGVQRERYIVNAFTRMRLCSATGSLDFTIIETDKNTHPKLKPWFEWRATEDKDAVEIYFGHWAALRGQCAHPTIHALDTGCCWGEELTAMRLEDGMRFSIASMDAN